MPETKFRFALDNQLFGDDGNNDFQDLFDEAVADGAVVEQADESETQTDTDPETVPPEGEGQETETETESDDANPEGNEADKKSAAQNDSLSDNADTPANQAFAQMRTENNQYKKTLQRAAKVAGFDKVEDYLAHLEDQTDEKEAKEQGIPKEVAKRINQLEEGERERQQALSQQQFEHRMRTFQSEAGLDNDQMKAFVTECVRQNIHLPTMEVPYSVLYQGMFHEDIQKKAVEDARQEWIIKDQETEDSASVPAGKGTADKGTDTVESFEDFEKLLANTDL